MRRDHRLHRLSPNAARSSFVAPPEADSDVVASPQTTHTSGSHTPGPLSGAVADRGGLPTVSARLGGGTVRLAVSMSVAYPVPLLEVTEEVRDLIRNRVAALTGLQVTSIEINISALVPPEGTLVESSGSSGRGGHA